MWLKSMDKLYRKHPTQCSTGILWKNTLSTYNLEYGTSSLTFTSFISRWGTPRKTGSEDDQGRKGAEKTGERREAFDRHDEASKDG